jgi:arginase
MRDDLEALAATIRMDEPSKGLLGLVSVPIDLGAGRRGVDMGPSAIRIAGLVEEVARLGYGVLEVGTVRAPGPELTEQGESRTRYLDEIEEICSGAYGCVLSAIREGALPLILGGDHSLSIGTVAAVAEHYRATRDEPIGLIWVDAHTDMNTPEITPSGNIHGMSLSVLLGHGPEALTALGRPGPAVAPGHVSVIGAREIDPKEQELVRASGVRVFTMSEVDERGMAACMDEALERACGGTAGFHLSFDLDSIEPLVAPGVGTPVAGGITYREAHLICEKAARSEKLVSLEMVELNPVLDLGNRTADVAVGLLASALGKRIL